VELIAKKGVIHGRFQPLHLGHLEYLLAGKQLCRHLIVGITNPDPTTIVQEEADTHRHLAEANPCTYYERLCMVEAALINAGVERNEFAIVPFPHSQMERISHYVPNDALFFLSIYDAWGETKLERFEGAGLHVFNLWRRKRKITSSAEIRQLIREKLNWQALVPSPVKDLIIDCGIDERIRLFGS
jgi:nicotinamide-nucleotide adenylyltransferase/phosphinothricin biosynthesis protein PhpF